MIHYHGTPITPNQVLLKMKGKNFFISYFRPDNIGLVSEICSQFVIDNGAFSAWTKGIKVDWGAYNDFIMKWKRHPSFAWHVIPDIIDGDEKANDDMIDSWDIPYGVPVWHMHESLERLWQLATSFERIALGSSGEYSQPGTDKWWSRMSEVMNHICIEGEPICKLHGMRMLDPKFRVLPLASADSTNLAQNLTDPNIGKCAMAELLIDRVEQTHSVAKWEKRPIQLELFKVEV